MNSIIIPVYNHEDTVERAVKSALAQTWGDFELILVDDGSTDGSLAECRRLASEHPEARIRVIAAEHGGVSSARNHGIEAARGEWVSFLDSDDELDPAFLERLMTKQAETGADWVYCSRRATYTKPTLWSIDLHTFDEDRLFSTPEELAQLEAKVIFAKEGNILFSTCMSVYRKSLLDEHALRFSTTVPYGEDILFNYQMAHYVSCFYYLAEPLYIYHVHEDSSSRTVLDKSLDEVPLIIEEYEQARKKVGGELTRAYLQRIGSYIETPFYWYLYHPQARLSGSKRKAEIARFEAMLAKEPVKTLWNQMDEKLFEGLEMESDEEMMRILKRKQYARGRVYFALFNWYKDAKLVYIMLVRRWRGFKHSVKERLAGKREQAGA